MQLSHAIERLLTATRADGRTLETVESYRHKLKPLAESLGDVPIRDIQIDHLRGYISDLMDRETRWGAHPKHEEKPGGLSPFTIAGYVRAMKRLFNWLEEEGELEDNPARRIRVPQPRREEPKGISKSGLLDMLAGIQGESPSDLRDRAVVLFLADTGCRVGGLCGLQAADVDLESRLALLREKGGKTRLVPFTRVTAEALRAWLAARPQDQGTALFLSLGNKAAGKFSPNGVRQMLQRRADRVGVEGPVNPHAFRHFFAREFLLNGGDLATLADLLGHSSVEVTKANYAIFTVQELQEKHRRHSPIARLLGGSTDGEQRSHSPTCQSSET